MKTITKIGLILALILAPTPSGAVVGSTRTLVVDTLDGVFSTPNLVPDGGFESGSSRKWTASGGATSAVNATAKGTGGYGYEWDSNASNQTLTSAAVTIPNSLLGKSAVASCDIKTPSGSATHTIASYDGSVSYGTTTVTSSTSFTRASAVFPMPLSGTIAIRIKSVASNEPDIYIDNCFISEMSMAGGTGIFSTPSNGQIAIGNGTGYTLNTITGTTNQVVVNNGGGSITLATPQSIATTSNVTFGSSIFGNNGTVSTPVGSFTGSIFTGGTATTTKPLLLLEPTGTASTGWSTNGTAIGVNAVSGFTGSLLDLQIAASKLLQITSTGATFYSTAGQPIVVSSSGALTVGTGGGGSLLTGSGSSGTALFSDGGGNPFLRLGNANIKLVRGANGFQIQTDPGGGLSIVPSAGTTGSPSQLSVTGSAHTTLTASTEAIDVNFNLARTVQFSTGALATQRAVVIKAPTYGFVGASTLTNASTFSITGPPVAGTNATITNPAAMVVETGNVGIGTTAPKSALHIGTAEASSANVGTLSLGAGPFDGSTTGFFAGNASGTLLAGNAASGFAGDLQDLSIAGSQKFKVNSAGTVVTGGNTSTNIVQDGSFENKGLGWVASGGATATTNTASAGTYNLGYDWDSNSAAQTLTSAAVTIPLGLRGKAAVVSCNISCLTGTCTHTLAAFDGTNPVGTPATITSSLAWSRSTSNFTLPSSGTIAVQLKSVASNEPEAYIDDCFISDAGLVSVVGVNSPTSWSGYQTVSGGCSTSSATYADPSACTSIAVTEQNNKNFGTVTTAASSLPGITFTPALYGNFLVCASGTVSTTLAAAISVRMTDGTTVLHNGVTNSVTAAGDGSFSICGNEKIATLAATTIKLQLATSTSTANILNGTASGSSAIQWSIVYTDATLPAPSAQRSDSYYNNYGGQGATNTKIAWFNSGRNNTGSGYTYASDHSFGDTWTINEAGLWAIDIGCQGTSGQPHCMITINDTNLASGGAGTYAQGYRTGCVAVAGGGGDCSAGFTELRAVGDVIRMHTDATALDTTVSHIHLVKVTP